MYNPHSMAIRRENRGSAEVCVPMPSVRRRPSVAPAARSVPAAEDRLATPPIRPGRPPKFGRRARPVTITLPEDLLEHLRAQHLDLGRAVVELFEERMPRDAPVQLAEFGRGALILVPPASALRRVTGVELIPLSNGRAMIALDQPMSTSDLELTLNDALADAALSDADRRVVQDVVGILREARTSAQARLRQRTIIIVERDGARRRRRA
jgi:hypothetical protein